MPPTGAPASPGETDGSPATASPAGPTPARSFQADTSQLVVAIDNLGTQQYAVHLASNENEYVTNIFAEQLTRLNPETREIEGLLAESFELSEDLMTWTFKLRPNIPFHDGWGTLTAEDVKWTWGEYVREDSTHDPAPVYRRAIGNDIDNFEVVSELEFRLHTDTPVVSLPADLCSCAGGMVITSQRYHEESPDADTKPIGTGPWKFISNTPSVEVVFDAVKDHWRSAPAYDKLIMREIPDGAARLIQVQSGAVDLALLSTELVNEASNTPGLHILSAADAGNAYINLGGQFYGPKDETDFSQEDQLDHDSPWIQSDAPAQGLAIRQAMSLAIDRELILERIVGDQGSIAHGPLLQNPNNPRLVDPAWSLPAYDPELARQKLAEGGYPDGFEFNWPIYDQKFGTAAIGEAVAGMWEEIGLRPNRRPMEEDAFDPIIDNRQTAGWAYIHVRQLFPEPAVSIITALPEREDAKFIDPVLTQAYRDMASTGDADERFALARQLIEHLNNEVRAIPLFVLDFPFVAGPDVANWTPIPGLDQVNSLDTVTPPS